MKKKFLFAAFALALLGGCVKDSFKFDKLKKSKYEPTVAAPLVFTTFKLADIIKQNESDLIHIDSEGFISLIYKSTLYSSTAEEMILLPNQTYNQTVAPGISGTIANGNTQTYSETQTLTFSASPNQLDTMILKSGSLNINVSSDFNADIDILLTIPEATLNGVAFSQTINVSAFGTGSGNYSLAGYTFDLTKNGTTTNEFDVDYQLTLTGNGGTINASDQLNIDIELLNLNFSKLFGILDISNATPEEDTVEITLFNSAAGLGQFSIVDPMVRLYSHNSLGSTVEATFNRMEGINTISGQTYDLATSGSLPPVWTINGPSYSQIGESIDDSLIINGTDVIDMINDQPKYFVYDISASTPASNPQIFALDTSRITFDAEVELPMHGSMNQFTIIDTVGLDLGMDAVKSLILTSRIRNGFPVEFDITFYTLEWQGISLVLTDSAYTSTDLLAASGVLDSDGRVSEKTETLANLELDESTTDNFASANYMIIKAVASTTNNGNTTVKFYDDYELEIKVGAIVEVSTEF